MGTMLRAAEVVRCASGSGSSIRLASEAAHNALHSAGLGPEDVDLVINVGVYRDGNICEPANAPMIQAAAKIALEPHRSFSFDLADGVGGCLAAARVAGDLFATQQWTRALIVAGDVDPTPDVSSGYRFGASAAALILEPGGADQGFCDFHSERFPAYEDWSRGVVRFEGDTETYDRIVVDTKPDYPKRLVDCAESAASAFLSRQRLETSDLRLVLAFDCGVGFEREIGERLGFENDRVFVPEGPALTSGPIEALAAARRADSSNRFPLLLLTAGAGIQVSIALYRPE